MSFFLGCGWREEHALKGNNVMLGWSTTISKETKIYESGSHV